MIPEVSVIVPTYNRAHLIERCIRSLLNQKTGIDYEIICVNDGSTDSTSEILKKFSSSIVILENSENMGLPSALNRGIRESSGRFIVRVDSDDYASVDMLDFLTKALRANPAIKAVSCDYLLIDELGQEEIVNCKDFPIACGIMFTRESLFSVGLYNEKYKMHEDKELRKRFEKENHIERLPIPLYRYYKHKENLTNNNNMSDYFLYLLNQDNK